MENQKTICDWADKTFGFPKSLSVSVNRMLEEVEELKAIDYKADEIDLEKVADECADIYITLVRIVDTIGYDLHSCVNHKMQINRVRKWSSNGDGTGKHMKE